MDEETRKYLIETLKNERQNLVYPGTKPRRVARPPALKPSAPAPVDSGEGELPSWESVMHKAIQLSSSSPQAARLQLKIAEELRKMQMLEAMQYEDLRRTVLSDLLDNKDEREGD